MSDISKTKSDFSSYDSWRKSQKFNEQEIREGVQDLYREILEFKLRELRQLKSLTQQQLAQQHSHSKNPEGPWHRSSTTKPYCSRVTSCHS